MYVTKIRTVYVYTVYISKLFIVFIANRMHLRAYVLSYHNKHLKDVILLLLMCIIVHIGHNTTCGEACSPKQPYY